VFVETYGCQMNVADSEVVSSLLQQHGYTFAPAAAAADVVLINTCAIRDNAEARIWGRLAQLRDTRRVRLREGR
jgi:tRNA-2-methylthio-N6-dimethylallyladenosine synthase